MIRLIGVMLTLTLGAAATGLWLHAGSSGDAEAAASTPDGAPAIAAAPSHSAAPGDISSPGDVTRPGDVTPPGDITPPTPRQPPLVFPDDGGEGLGAPVCGGAYGGEFEGSGTILIVVADDCETIASVETGNHAGVCVLPAELTFDPPLAIEDSMFFGWTTTNTVFLSGSFTEGDSIVGTIGVGDPLCFASFVAERIVELPTTGGSFGDTDSGVSPGVWALIGALVAAGAAGLAVFGWRCARIH